MGRPDLATWRFPPSEWQPKEKLLARLAESEEDEQHGRFLAFTAFEELHEYFRALGWALPLDAGDPGGPDEKL